jgi:hypothetical protein
MEVTQVPFFGELFQDQTLFDGNEGILPRIIWVAISRLY